MNTAGGVERARRDNRRDWALTGAVFLTALLFLGAFLTAGVLLFQQRTVVDQIRVTQRDNATIIRDISRAESQIAVAEQDRQRVLGALQGILTNLQTEEAAGVAGSQQIAKVIGWVECKLGASTGTPDTCGPAPPP